MSQHTETLIPTTTNPLPGRTDRCIAALLSGGVDSSVTALLLQQEGWDVVGVTMRMPGASEEIIASNGDAARVAQTLGIPHYVVDLRGGFTQCVIQPFQEEYLAGRTPNPCITCNATIKFGLLAELIESQLDIHHFATGHYADIRRAPDGSAQLCRGENRDKDQSYFLYRVNPALWSRIHFPLKGRPKSETRALAAEAGLPVATKSDSQDLCFAAGGDYRDALPDGLSNQPGPFLNIHGERVGTHRGIMNYTVGQRKLGVSFGSEPSFALRILPSENAIIVGTRAESMQEEVSADRLIIHQPHASQTRACLFGKIRSAGDPTPCTVLHADASTIRVRFDRPMFAPTPGQHLVLYDASDAVVVGGIITSTL